MMVDNNSGWWYTYPSEKYEFVSWGYYSQYMEKYKMIQTTNQTTAFRNGTSLLSTVVTLCASDADSRSDSQHQRKHRLISAHVMAS